MKAAAVTELTRQDISLHMCPPCLADLCFMCFGGTCRCACIDMPPLRALAVQPGPQPDRRCPACTYPYGSVGHRVTCEEAGRVNCLAGAVNRSQP